jgi:hypothetical protein
MMTMKKISNATFRVLSTPACLDSATLGAIDGGFLDSDHANISSKTEEKITRKNSGNAFHPNSFNDQSQDILIDNSGNLGQTSSGPSPDRQQPSQ